MHGVTTQNQRDTSILLVDDHVDLADSLGQILEESGHGVAVAYDGERALALAVEKSPSVAILDYRIGSAITGLELLTRLRTIVPDIVCIVMTADTEQEIAIGALKAGVFDYLRKPADPVCVLSVAEAAVARAREIRQTHDERVSLIEKADAAEARRNFMRSLGAEIREPLSLVLGFAELLAPGASAPGSPSQSEAIEHIKTSANELLNAVSTAAELTCTPPCDDSEGAEPADIASLLARLHENSMQQAKLRGTHFEVADSGPFPPVFVRKPSAKRTLTLLIDAAFALGVPAICISASTNHPQGVVTVSVTCHGSDTKRVLQGTLPNALNLAQVMAWRAGIKLRLELDRAAGFSALLDLPLAVAAMREVA